MLGLSLLLLAIVAAEHFLLTPRITEMGRFIDDVKPSDPQYKTFWMLHGFYSGLDILKMLVAVVLGFLLVVRRKPDEEHLASQHAATLSAEGSLRRG
jgi:hypothetical protein